MMVDGRRGQRIADMIRQEIANLIIHGDIKDPRVEGLITVTRVEMTPDMKLARVFVSILKDDHDRETVLKGLKNASGYMKAQIAHHLKLRHTPSLQFKLDDSLDYSDKIDQLLKESKK